MSFASQRTSVSLEWNDLQGQSLMHTRCLRSGLPKKLAVYRQRRAVGLESIEIVITQPFKARTSEELMALLGAVATAILASIIIITLYFGREIFVPIALAILLSFVLAPWLDYFSVSECRGDWRS